MLIKTATQVCHLCYSDNIILDNPGESWVVHEKEYRVVRCVTCGVAFTDPIPEQDLLEEFYKTSFSFKWYEDHLGAKLRDARDRFDEYKFLVDKSILDFGGGLGYFSQICREAGHKSLTYDPYVSTKAESGQWDVVVALHVLEHSSDPNKTIEQMKGHLVPGGQLILAVPNYAGAGYRSQGMKWVWAQPPLLHIFHFTVKSLVTQLERHGFHSIRVHYSDRWDANTWCDIEQARLTRQLDGAWSRRPFRTVSPLRKALARFNSYRRFRGLVKSNSNIEGSESTLSELQIRAVAP